MKGAISLLSLSSRGALAAMMLFGSHVAAAQTQPNSIPGGTTEPDATPTAGTPTPGSDAEIIVTANKRSEAISRVPMSITAVSGDALASQGVTEVRDLVKIVPGFQYTQSLTGTPVFTLRGIGFYDVSFAGKPTVTVYVDEAPLPYSLQAIGAPLDPERVEVLKGPQGTLFGQNATGGAINYIAAKPTHTFQAGVDVSLGSYYENRVRGFVSGPLSDRIRARLAFDHQGGGAWQRSYTRKDSLGDADVTIGRLLLDFDATEKLTLRLNVNGFLNKSDTQAPKHVSFFAQTPANVVRINPAIPSFPNAPNDTRSADWDPGADLTHDDRFVQVSLRANYELSSNMTLTSLTTYNNFTGAWTQDLDGTPYQAPSIDLGGSIRGFSQELRLSGEFGSGTKYIIGANYQYDRTIELDTYRIPDATTSYALVSFGGPQYPILYLNTDTKNKTSGVFANVDQDIGEHFTLHAGIRYARAIADYIGGTGCNGDLNEGRQQLAITRYLNAAFRVPRGLSPVPDIQPGQCSIFDPVTLIPGPAVYRLSEDSVSWRAGVDWKPSSQTLVYANVSRGYKAGAFPTFGAVFTTAYSPATQEAVTAYEVGVKTSAFNRAVQFAGALFYYDYKDKQILGAQPDPAARVLKKLINIPNATVKGAEAQVTVRPVHGLSVTLAGTYLDTKIVGPFSNYTTFADVVEIGGDAFPYTPKWQGRFDAEYRFPVSDEIDMFVGGAATGQTHSYAGIGQLDIQRLNGYALFDARAGIESKGGLSVTAWIRNIGDRYYWVNADRYNDHVVRYAGRPRTFGFTVGYRFGS